MSKRKPTYRTYTFKNGRDPVLERIDKLRAIRGKTFKEVSDISGVSTGTLGAWRRKTRRPQFCTVMAVLRALEVDLTERVFTLRTEK